MGKSARVTGCRGVAERVAALERYVFLSCRTNGIVLNVLYTIGIYIWDDRSVSRRRSNIYLDEDEGNNEDDADLGKEDKDADINWGMMTMEGPL